MKKLLVAAIVGLSVFSSASEEASAFDGRIRGMFRRAVYRDSYYQPVRRAGFVGTVRRGADSAFNLGEDAVGLYLDLNPTMRVLQGKSPLPF